MSKLESYKSSKQTTISPPQTIWERRLVWNAQTYKSYMSVQQAHPGNLYIGTALIKTFRYAMTHLTKKLAANFDNDAKVAHARLVSPLSTIED